MIVPDVNLLLYAHFAGFAEHARARAWWSAALAGDRSVGLCAPAVFGFVRVATNPRAIQPPLGLADALGTVEEWFARSNARFIRPGPRHIEIALDLLRAAGSAGNLTTDAQIAAHAVEERGEVHSHDTDFARFAGLRWVDPLS